MAGLVKMAIDRYVNLVDSISDERVNDWPLMTSPIPTVAMVAAYLYVVMFLGPRVMANRKPFKLNNVLIVYNAAQVVFSLIMLWEPTTTPATTGFGVTESIYPRLISFAIAVIMMVVGIYELLRAVNFLE